MGQGVTNMSIVLMSEKGQVTIPQDIRRKLKIGKGDPLLVELCPQGDIRMRVAAVLPLETYSEERLKEFEREDTLTPEERRRLQKTLHA
jgi:AbrB family looped-hinge helix DNA binding protein